MDTLENDRLFQLHLAEYNALTMRGTYLINTQVLLFLGLISWIGATTLILFSTTANETMPWTIITVGQIIGMITAWLFIAEHNIVLYIEKELRLQLNKLILDKRIWQYENYLARLRTKKDLMVEYLHGVAALFGLVLVVGYRLSAVRYCLRDFKYFDWIGLIVNIVLLVKLFLMLIESHKIQKQTWDSIKTFVSKSDNDNV